MKGKINYHQSNLLVFKIAQTALETVIKFANLQA